MSDFKISPAVVNVEILTKQEGISFGAYVKKILHYNHSTALNKVFDRANNSGTVAEAFTAKKIHEQLTETKEHILPLSTIACELYSEYSDHLCLLKHTIETLVNQSESYLRLLQESEDRFRTTEAETKDDEYKLNP